MSGRVRNVSEDPVFNNNVCRQPNKVNKNYIELIRTNFKKRMLKPFGVTKYFGKCFTIELFLKEMRKPTTTN